ncbi:unnamed protein product, partial [Musa banksii]
SLERIQLVISQPAPQSTKYDQKVPVKVEASVEDKANSSSEDLCTTVTRLLVSQTSPFSNWYTIEYITKYSCWSGQETTNTICH